jgi:Domain of unknown function (DUF4124)
MRRVSIAVAALAILLASAARADIFEWRDPSGARHFTNSKDGVPAEYQSVARVVVADWQHPAAAAQVPAPAPPVTADTPRAAQMVSDSQAWRAGYSAGMNAAAELGGGGGGGGAATGTGGAVQIYGPLAIATTRVREGVPAFPYAPYYSYAPSYWEAPYYYPLVTTSFDRGRSRHQTLRMLLQDQFQLDRDGPYAYDRWDQPGLGPALAPFLPRGLPRGLQQGGRVIYR